jgi:hypothetical protein
VSYQEDRQYELFDFDVIMMKSHCLTMARSCVACLPSPANKQIKEIAVPTITNSFNRFFVFQQIIIFRAPFFALSLSVAFL